MKTTAIAGVVGMLGLLVIVVLLSIRHTGNSPRGVIGPSWEREVELPWRAMVAGAGW